MYEPTQSSFFCSARCANLRLTPRCGWSSADGCREPVAAAASDHHCQCALGYCAASRRVFDRLETIHDFWGFPEELYALRYPATGCREGASAVVKAIEATGLPVDKDSTRGPGSRCVVAFAPDVSECRRTGHPAFHSEPCRTVTSLFDRPRPGALNVRWFSDHCLGQHHPQPA